MYFSLFFEVIGVFLRRNKLLCVEKGENVIEVKVRNSFWEKYKFVVIEYKKRIDVKVRFRREDFVGRIGFFVRVYIFYAFETEDGKREKKVNFREVCFGDELRF